MEDEPSPPGVAAPVVPDNPELTPAPPTPPAPPTAPGSGSSPEELAAAMDLRITERMRELASAERIDRRLQSLEDRMGTIQTLASEVLQSQGALIDLLTEPTESQPDGAEPEPTAAPSLAPQREPEPEPERQARTGILDRVAAAIR